MNRNSLYIKNICGHFPDAKDVQTYWKNLLRADVASSQSLSFYWNEPEEEYSNTTKDGHIYMDRGHLANFSENYNEFPRQISAGINVIENILKDSGLSESRNDVSLILASEWTDHSWYQEVLGKIEKGDGFSVERQVEVLKSQTGLGGVSLAVDTACASSLYAIELARGVLESGISKHVIVVGLNMYLHSFLYRGFSKLGALSKRGRLTSFDAEADGIVPGEAACAILVDNDFAGAIAQIDGIGLSTDGNEGSAFSPGYHGQLEAYRRAYEDSSLTPSQIDYLEAHGTATILGDQTEIKSIHDFFSRTAENEIIVGACKSNIGHTLAASGLASVIKSSFIIKEKMMPPHIPINRNPLVEQKGIRILDRKKKINKNRVAVGISSFGFGGSNAHVILRTPEENIQTSKQESRKKIFIRSRTYIDNVTTKAPGPILKGIPMGPRMQERVDPFQRLALTGVQDLIKRSQLTNDERDKLSCVCLNNMGGSLSLDFEKKYRAHQNGPVLSIEAVASTLPSMISGYPALLFNMRGHHMLISSARGGFGVLLALMPYLLERSEGDIVLMAGRKNWNDENCKEGMGFYLFSREQNTSKPALAAIELVSRLSDPVSNIDMMEASGLLEFNDCFNKGQGDYNVSLERFLFKVSVLESFEDENEIVDDILNESLINRNIALDYLNLVSHFHPSTEVITADKYGDFIVNCERTGNRATAELVVDEEHSYFFDHPLDHVPGILMIHGCEELLDWYIDGDYLSTGMKIRFTRFLEKEGQNSIHLKEKESGQFLFEIRQNDVVVCLLDISVEFQNPGVIRGEVSEKILSIEQKKYTHKHRSENILVSALDGSDRFHSQARDLDEAGNRFLHHLVSKRQSMLFLGEVTRQFVMLMAHLEKEISLDMKMNLISIELNVSKWVQPPFDLRLNKFDIIDSDKFMLTDVIIDFVNRDKKFGEGKIKAQVVSKDYYSKQRGGQ
jgi:3-oxoacyl-(acyl-carrier-protein) synthase